jgi:hypothetical protein
VDEKLCEFYKKTSKENQEMIDKGLNKMYEGY